MGEQSANDPHQTLGWPRVRLASCREVPHCGGVRDQRLDDVLPAAQAGQPWALRVLYDELAPRVHGYLRSRGAAEAEDLTSEVFLAVFPRLGTVTGGARPACAPWSSPWRTPGSSTS